MTYKEFEKTGEKISLLGFGAMRFPTTEDGKIDRVASQEMIDMAYEDGVNYFDTAYMYHDGESQSFLGQALKKYDRKSYFITNKLPLWMCENAADMEKIFNDQLTKCGVEYFDFYLVHAMDSDRLKMFKDFGTKNFLTQKRAEGKIRQIGFSFHDATPVLEEICNEGDWDFAQLQLNYLDWEYQDAKGQYEILEKHNIPCIVMEPIRGGSLASLTDDANAVLKEYDKDSSIASWAMRYAASLPNVMTVLSGMSDKSQVLDNLNTMKDFTVLTDEEQALVAKALDLYKKTTLLPCTACRYCIDCPVKVNIPEVFSLYNRYKLNKNKDEFISSMKKIDETNGAGCIECEACVPKCPQKIDIPEELKNVQKLLAELA